MCGRSTRRSRPEPTIPQGARPREAEKSPGLRGIGRRGTFIKPLLERCPQVRVRIEGETVSVSGPLDADVEYIVDTLRARVQTQLTEERAIAERKDAEDLTLLFWIQDVMSALEDESLSHATLAASPVVTFPKFPRRARRIGAPAWNCSLDKPPIVCFSNETNHEKTLGAGRQILALTTHHTKDFATPTRSAGAEPRRGSTSSGCCTRRACGCPRAACPRK